jgi:DNA repair exonuclease SbcCD ATPase subunit
MLIQKLKLDYFGRFHGLELDIKPGINLVYGENEAGKSTIHAFIRGMLFGIERMRGRAAASKGDIYTRYLPWDYTGAFRGLMDIRVEDKEYRLQRSFHVNDKSFTVTDLSTGREVLLKEEHISELVEGLTESIYKNTISIEQLKTRTDRELASQVNNYIANLSVAKCREVNVTKALCYLAEQKKALEAAIKTSELKTLQIKINEGNEKEKKIEALTIQLKSLLAKENQIKTEKDAVMKSQDSEEVKQIEQLPAMIEKYHIYQKLSRQNEALRQQEAELKDKTAVWERAVSSEDTLREELKETKMLESRLSESSLNTAKLKRDKASLVGDHQKIRRLSVTAGVVIAVILLLISGLHPIGVLLAVISSIAGFLINIILKRSTMGKQQQLDNSIKAEETKQKEASMKLKDIYNRYQVNKSDELSQKQEEVIKQYYALENAEKQFISLKERRSQTEDSMDEIYEIIMRYVQYFIREEELTDSTMCRLHEEIQCRKQQITKKQMIIDQEYDDMKLMIEKQKWKISALEDNEDELIKNEARYEELSHLQEQNETELEAVTLAINTIKQLSVDIHDSFGRQLNAVISGIIADVTGQKYTDIKVDEKLDVKAGWNKDFIQIDKLSTGTIDQFYFALRLAVAGLLLDDSRMPLILDECFAHYDENRLKAALCQIAGRQQVILFTCHKREKKILEELGIPYNFIDLL